MEQEVLVLDGGPLSGPQVVAVARSKCSVDIGPVAIDLMQSLLFGINMLCCSAYAISLGWFFRNAPAH